MRPVFFFVVVAIWYVNTLQQTSLKSLLVVNDQSPVAAQWLNHSYSIYLNKYESYPAPQLRTILHIPVCTPCCCPHWVSMHCHCNWVGPVAAASSHHKNWTRLWSGHLWSSPTPNRTHYCNGKLNGEESRLDLNEYCVFLSGESKCEGTAYLLSLTSLCVMLYRAEKPSLATAMSVWKARDRIPVEDWISGGTLVPQ